MKRTVAGVIGCLVILGTGIVHGTLTLRWFPPTQVLQAAERVPQFPLQVGEWTGTELHVPEEEMKMTGAYGYLSRRYTHRTTGQTITVMLLCGRTGPLTVHSPTVCFEGAGMEVASDIQRYSLIGDSHRPWGALWTSEFANREKVNGSRVRLFWGWSNDAADWQAPDHPRITLAGAAYLYKLYVQRGLPLEGMEGAGSQLLDDDPCVEFLRVFLPEAKRALRPSRTAGPA